MNNLAEVWLWGQRVGVLAAAPGDTTFAFEYDDGWLSSGVSVSPLHLPLRRQVFQFPGLPAEAFKHLPGVFADTLPDDFGNAVINAWLAREGRDAGQFHALDRLLYTGSRGMGAMEYHPAMRRSSSNGNDYDLQVPSLMEMAQQVLDERAGLQTNISDPDKGNSDAMEAILQVGTSAGGARPKAVVAINADMTEIRSGQVDAPAGFEHYLLKFDGVVEKSTGRETFGDPLGYGRMEYAYYLMARSAGISMMPSTLLEENGRAHFVTKRFDRDGNRKRHGLTLCGIDHADYKQPGTYSYEAAFRVLRQLGVPRKDAVELYRRMVFNVLARNYDDHTKNFSFVLDRPNAEWRLSPAYDVAYSYRPGSPWVNSHQMTINGKRDGFALEDLMAVADQIHNFRKEAAEIMEAVQQSVSQWPEFAEQAGVPDALATTIQSNLRVLRSR